MIKFHELLPTTQAYFRTIYDEIDGSREKRRDAGFVTGPTVDLNGKPWFRNVDPLPPFSEWMAEVGVKV